MKVAPAPWLFLVTAILSLSCHRGTPAAPASLEREMILHTTLAPCPTRPAASAGRDQLFVETVLLEVPLAEARAASQTRLFALAREPGARLLGTPHLLGDVGARSESTLLEASGRITEPLLHRFVSEPARATDGRLTLALEVSLLVPHPTAAQPALVAVPLAAVVAHERPVALTAPVSADHSLLALVKVHAVRAEADLRAIFECKMRARAAWLGARR